MTFNLLQDMDILFCASFFHILQGTGGIVLKTIFMACTISKFA